jgi:hypothetical protein
MAVFFGNGHSSTKPRATIIVIAAAILRRRVSEMSAGPSGPNKV